MRSVSFRAFTSSFFPMGLELEKPKEDETRKDPYKRRVPKGAKPMGAIARAQRCADAFKAAHGAWPDYAVGLEGGVCEENLAAEHPGVAGLAPVLQCFAWMACYRPTPVQGRPSWGFARTGSFEVPPRVVALMRSGMELGDADDKIFGELNSKQKGGSVAKVTQGVIDRTAYYEHAMLLALAPFVHDESGLYGDPAEPLIVPRE